MHLTQRFLFTSSLLTIRHAVARPSAAAISELEFARGDLLLLPLAGVFAKHEGPRQRFIANANHVLFFPKGQAYRISFPGNLGDESLVLEFSPSALAELLQTLVGIQSLHSKRLQLHGLLPALALAKPRQLWYALNSQMSSTLALEENCIDLLATALQSASREILASPSTAHQFSALRRQHQVETVKEVISLQPAHDWSLDKLAGLCHTSSFHLARLFRWHTGIPVHRYLVRMRLLKALELMQAGKQNFTEIALETGFNQHSHFSSSFRTVFRQTPSKWRQAMNQQKLKQACQQLQR